MNTELLVDSNKNYSYELTLNDLARSGKYNLDLIRFLKNGDIDAINLYTTESEREDISFMEPLLYAVKHDLNTFEVFRYCNEKLQRNVARDVIKEEPELIADTPLSKDARFIIRNARFAPQIVRYADDRVLENSFVVYSLCMVNARVATEVLKATNSIVRNSIGEAIEETIKPNRYRLPALSNDREFVSAAIQERGASFLKYASEEIKNDFEFLKEHSSKDPSIIDYVVDHMDEFGKEGIDAVRETSKEKTINDIMDAIAQNEENKLNYFQKMIEERGSDDPALIRVVTAYYAKDEIDVSPEMLNGIINYSLLTMESIRREMEERSDYEIAQEDIERLIDIRVIKRLEDKLAIQGISIDENTKQKIDSYIEFFNNTKEKYDLQRKKRLENEIEKICAAKSVEELLNIEEQDGNVMMAAVSLYSRTDNPNIDTLKNIMNCYLILFDRTKEDIEENGFIYGERDGRELIPVLAMNKILSILEENGVVLDDETQKRINEYKEFVEECKFKRREVSEKRQLLYQEIVEKTSQKNNEITVEHFTEKLNYAMKKMEVLMNDLDTNGNMRINDENIAYLPSPVDLVKMRKYFKDQGITIDPELDNNLNSLIYFTDYYKDKARDYHFEKRRIISTEEINNIIANVEASKIHTIDELLKSIDSNTPEAEKFKSDIESLRTEMIIHI